MTKIISMVSHKNYNLNANEGFVIVSTSKLIISFIVGFTTKTKSKLIAYLLNESEHTHTHTYIHNIYIRFWTLKMKCIQYEICE